MVEKKVLVLMATYNGERFLKEQLNSIFNQIGVSVSLLVRDDKSTDKTLSILNEYKENYDLKIVDSESDLKHGPMHNYYNLLREAQKRFSDAFDFFALADQDDVWEKNKLIKMIQKVSNFKKPQLVYANYAVIDEKDNVVVENTSRSLGLNPTNPLALLFTNSFAWGHSILFNSALLKNISLSKRIRESGFPHDAYLAKYAVLCDGILYEDSVLVKYRRYSNNVSGMWYKLSLKVFLEKIDLVKESKIYANIVNGTLLAIDENYNNDYVNKNIINKYKKGIRLRGLKSLNFFKKENIFRIQWQRNANMKLMYALGWYKKWIFKDKKMVKL